MSIKFTARGSVDELRALFNLLNQAGQVTELKSGDLYRDKSISDGKQTFEVTLTGARHWDSRQYRERDGSGYVYLLETPEKGVYKIGKTKDPQNRRKTFGVLLPFHVDYLVLIETEDMHGLEKYLHRRFQRQRLLKSEFFELSERDVAYIESL